MADSLNQHERTTSPYSPFSGTGNVIADMLIPMLAGSNSQFVGGFNVKDSNLYDMSSRYTDYSRFQGMMGATPTSQTSTSSGALTGVLDMFMKLGDQKMDPEHAQAVEAGVKMLDKFQEVFTPDGHFARFIRDIKDSGASVRNVGSAIQYQYKLASDPVTGGALSQDTVRQRTDMLYRELFGDPNAPNLFKSKGLTAAETVPMMDFMKKRGLDDSDKFASVITRDFVDKFQDPGTSQAQKMAMRSRLASLGVDDDNLNRLQYDDSMASDSELTAVTNSAAMKSVAGGMRAIQSLRNSLSPMLDPEVSSNLGAFFNVMTQLEGKYGHQTSLENRATNLRMTLGALKDMGMGVAEAGALIGRSDSAMASLGYRGDMTSTVSPILAASYKAMNSRSVFGDGAFGGLSQGDQLSAIAEGIGRYGQSEDFYKKASIVEALAGVELGGGASADRLRRYQKELKSGEVGELATLSSDELMAMVRDASPDASRVFALADIQTSDPNSREQLVGRYRDYVASAAPATQANEQRKFVQRDLQATLANVFQLDGPQAEQAAAKLMEGHMQNRLDYISLGTFEDAAISRLSPEELEALGGESRVRQMAGVQYALSNKYAVDGSAYNDSRIFSVDAQQDLANERARQTSKNFMRDATEGLVNNGGFAEGLKRVLAAGASANSESREFTIDEAFHSFIGDLDELNPKAREEAVSRLGIMKREQSRLQDIVENSTDAKAVKSASIQLDTMKSPMGFIQSLLEKTTESKESKLEVITARLSDIEATAKATGIDVDKSAMSEEYKMLAAEKGRLQGTTDPVVTSTDELTTATQEQTSATKALTEAIRDVSSGVVKPAADKMPTPTADMDVESAMVAIGGPTSAEIASKQVNQELDKLASSPYKGEQSLYEDLIKGAANGKTVFDIIGGDEWGSKDGKYRKAAENLADAALDNKGVGELVSNLSKLGRGSSAASKPRSRTLGELATDVPYELLNAAKLASVATGTFAPGVSDLMEAMFDKAIEHYPAVTGETSDMGQSRPATAEEAEQFNRGRAGVTDGASSTPVFNNLQIVCDGITVSVDTARAQQFNSKALT